MSVVVFTPPDRTSLEKDGAFLVNPAGQRILDLAGPPAVPAPVHLTRFTGYGSRLAETFRTTCREQDIQGTIEGGGTEWRIEFSGQETAPGALMGEALRVELLDAGILCADTIRLHAAMDETAAQHMEAVIRHGVQRLRTLLVEYNSYLSGGLRYAFPPSADGLAERGLAIYRFPKLAEVDVTAVEDRIRIAMHKGPLGKVTSSGFYLPTLLTGTFSVEADYEFCDWQPSATEPGCFALFAQNEDSARRYYAQRMSAAGEPHRLVASMVDVLSTELPVTGSRGSFRIVRQSATITCFHRTSGDEEWLFVGDAPAPPDAEMLVGAKIWSKLECGGLTVEIANFRVDGRLADRQVPPVPVVPDPRSNSASHS